MMNALQKIRHILHSPALAAIRRWTAPVRGRVVLICLLTAAVSAFSLGLTLTTRGLIDGAVASRADVLRRYGILMVALALADRGTTLLSLLRTGASARLQRSMQNALASALLRKDYSALKGYHSGELANRFFRMCPW